ncbi:MAG: hypothetical protein ACM3X4_02475 [Ignavibacteriales bacterium]
MDADAASLECDLSGLGLHFEIEGRRIRFQDLSDDRYFDVMRLVALFVGIMLDPRIPHEWNEVSLVLSFAIVVLAALSTGFVIWQNADNKMDILVLKAGRPAYYVAMVLASMLATIFWMGVIAAYMCAAVRLPGGVPPGGVARLAWSLSGNMLVPVALFILFSTLVGRPIEPYFAAMVLMLSLGDFQRQPWQRLTILLPPLVENAKAAAGMGEPQFLRCLAYALVALSLGLWRFLRREFIWS